MWLDVIILGAITWFQCQLPYDLWWCCCSHHTLVWILQRELPAVDACLWPRIPQPLHCLYPSHCNFWMNSGQKVWITSNVALLPVFWVIARSCWLFPWRPRFWQAYWLSRPMKHYLWSSFSSFPRSSTGFSTVENTLIPSGLSPTRSSTMFYSMTWVKGMKTGTVSRGIHGQASAFAYVD